MFLRRFGVLLVLLAGLLGVGTAGAETTSYNDVDEHFAEMMVPHHYQAILMSELAPDRGSDQELLALADRIRLEQGLEIQTLQGWQGRNNLPVTDPPTAYQELLGMPEHLAEMGMATKEQMDQLATLKGADFDRMFLDLMIPHHEGAVRMMREVILYGTDQDLNQMANDMMTTQKSQLDTMYRIRARM